MLSQRLMTQLLPDVTSEYSMSDGALIGLLMNAIADETQAGVQRRLEDIEQLQEILQSAKSLLTDDEVKVVDEPLVSYRLSDVNTRHDTLTRVLIGIHEVAEGAPEQHAELLARIWRYLRAHANRHAITAIP